MQRDIVLRWIEQIAAVIARILRRDPTLSLTLARQYLEDAEAQVLGPLGDLVANLDPETAAGLLGDPTRIWGYTQTLALRSALERAAGSAAEADATAERALAMGWEACHRADPAPAEWTEWLTSVEADLRGR